MFSLCLFLVIKCVHVGCYLSITLHSFEIITTNNKLLLTPDHTAVARRHMFDAQTCTPVAS